MSALYRLQALSSRSCHHPIRHGLSTATEFWMCRPVSLTEPHLKGRHTSLATNHVNRAIDRHHAGDEFLALMRLPVSFHAGFSTEN